MITKLLVANRGEIAVRIMRTARAMGIATVAVYSEPDALALHVDAADEAVALGGATPPESYLRGDALLEAAARSGADAVHPGYGFLAENPEFAQACTDAGLVFVGPSAPVIESMGDKLLAKQVMRDAGVPVLDSWSPEQVPADAYPVIVKAAAGGGGKGMRVVECAADLPEAVAAAKRESAGAFGDDRVFIERYLTRPRHVEVQILGDEHGNVVHLGERECSIQRRHQKVIEESPSPAVDAGLRKALGDAAVAAAGALSYTNAGTVEFVLGPAGDFFFLEVNTRLQVEHPVTELAWALRGSSTRLDLVRLQLLVAAGEPLPFAQDDVVLVGHAVEARLYAEDPSRGFLPATGVVEVWDPATNAGVRWDAGVRAGSEVGVFYDPLLAKVIAAGPTRSEAALRLASALAGSRIHGVTTNRDFLVATLRHPAFLAGEVHTGFIEEHWDAATRLAARPSAEVRRLHAVAAALAAARDRRRSAPVLSTIPPGWRNNRGAPSDVAGGYEVLPGWQSVTYDVDGADPVALAYHRRRDGAWAVREDGPDADPDELAVIVRNWPDERTDGAIDLEVGGRRLRARVSILPDDAGVAVDSPLGASRLVERPRFPSAVAEEPPGSLHAPMPGTVLSVAVAEGEEVAEGALVAVIEAMKMEHRLTAPHAGVVSTVAVAAGDQVAADDIVAVITPTDG